MLQSKRGRHSAKKIYTEKNGSSDFETYTNNGKGEKLFRQGLSSQASKHPALSDPQADSYFLEEWLSESDGAVDNSPTIR